VTDIAPGYDHITAAMGGVIAGMAGADFLCATTPSEHLDLPTKEDVSGDLCDRVAAHADLVRPSVRKAGPGPWMAKARRSWTGKGSSGNLRPARAKQIRQGGLRRIRAHVLRSVCDTVGERAMEGEGRK
jgi:phosphomethylpyrimidine synthase